VEIKKDTIIRNKFHPGFTRTKDVTIMAVHGTGGGGTLHWIRNTLKSSSARARMWARGVALFHYLIRRNGEIWNIIDPTKWVYHASIGKLDIGTIGVEMLNPDPRNINPYTKAQYQALEWLYAHVRENFYAEMNTIAGHGRLKQKVSGGWKNCPGEGFYWNQFRQILTENNWVYKYKEPYESIWNLERAS